MPQLKETEDQRIIALKLKQLKTFKYFLLFIFFHDM